MAFGKLDAKPVAAPLLRVIGVEPRAQLVRQDAHDGIGVRVEIRWLVEDIDAEGIALQRLGPSFERLGHDMDQKALEARRVREMTALDDTRQVGLDHHAIGLLVGPTLRHRYVVVHRDSLLAPSHFCILHLQRGSSS